MMHEQPSQARSGDVAAGYAYPEDLVRLVQNRWKERPETSGSIFPLPDAATLHEFFSASYQASMMRDEERPVTFRAILAEPAHFATEGRPPVGLQRFEFSSSLPFDPAELRQLSVVADPQRTLIGVRQDPECGLRIWGLVNSGKRWLRDVHGGRQAGVPLPSAPVIRVDAPGSIAAYRGDELVGKLQGGRLSGSRVDVFESEWLPRQFIPFRDELAEQHHIARSSACTLAGETWARLEPDLQRRITERLHKRIIAILREKHHGGTILFLPLEDATAMPGAEAYIDLRHRILEGVSRSCFPLLIVSILNRLARLYGNSGLLRAGTVGWEDFETTTDDEITTLDESLFEMAHLFAGLAEADGALVLNNHHDLLGFGGMISGSLPDVRTVWKALDLEGENLAEEEIGSVGARHRSAYRIAAILPGSVAIVISQDGGVRFVSQKGGRVVYWEHD